MVREVAVTDKKNNVAVWSILNDDVVEGLISGAAAEIVARKAADNAIVAGLTQGSTAGPEIALARGGYATLGEKVNAAVFNVRDYGAKCDGTTDDTAAIQAAIDAAKNGGGGKVLVPGRSAIAGNLTIRGPLIHLAGLGAGDRANGGVSITELVRTAGSGPILTVTGTPLASNPGTTVTISDVAFRSPTVGGTLLHLDCVSDAKLTRVRLSNTTGTGLRLTGVMNSFVENLVVFGCGTGTTSPAILIDSVVAGGSGGGSSTVKFTGLLVFACNGTEIKLTGSTADASPTDAIQFLNWSIERLSTQTATFPAIDLDYTQGAKFMGGRIYFGGDCGGSALTLSTADANAMGNHFIGTEFNWAGTRAFGVNHVGGSLSLIGCTFGGAATAQYRIGPSAARVVGQGLIFQSVPAGTIRISDARATNVKLGQREVPVMKVTGAAAASSVGTLPVWEFADAASNDLWGVVTVPDRVLSGSVIFRLFWTIAGGVVGNVVWSVGVQHESVGHGWPVATTGATWPAATTAYSLPAASQIAMSDILTSSTSPSLVSGQLLGVRLTRLGSDALDTAAAIARFVSISVIFNVEP